jgi:hypothetical protein
MSLWRMTKKVMRVTTPTPTLVTPGGIALSDSEKAEALAESLEAQFQPVADPSDPTVIETVDVALRAYSYEPGSEPMLTDPAEVDTIWGLKISKVPGPDDVPNRALKHHPQRMVLLLVAIFNTIFRTQYFPPVWKHQRSKPKVMTASRPVDVARETATKRIVPNSLQLGAFRLPRLRFDRDFPQL